MYIFHRTSEEKIQSEAPLLVVPWNFISTVQRMKSKRKQYPADRKQQDIIFFLSSRGGGEVGAAVAVHVLIVEVWKVATVPTSGSVWHRQTSCPPALGLKATSMLSVRAEDVSTEARSTTV